MTHRKRETERSVESGGDLARGWIGGREITVSYLPGRGRRRGGARHGAARRPAAVGPWVPAEAEGAKKARGEERYLAAPQRGKNAASFGGRGGSANGGKKEEGGSDRGRGDSAGPFASRFLVACLPSPHPVVLGFWMLTR